MTVFAAVVVGFAAPQGDYSCNGCCKNNSSCLSFCGGGGDEKMAAAMAAVKFYDAVVAVVTSRFLSHLQHLVVECISLTGGSSLRLSEQRALKRTGKIGSNFGNGKGGFFANCA